ncbi:MAG: 3D domain-containing protein [Candidatus Hydrogenedentes bacterium]|nr:3D domain-containing protein [Candidatus Hydrogenedentota bacterium]
MRRSILGYGLLVVAAVLIAGCATTSAPQSPPTMSKNMVVTGYCKCGKCCNWKRSWLGMGRPVIASGKYKGHSKKVGVTASGTKAKVGTIAADTTKYPFGTIMYVPGYGYGRVEDRGSAIQGEHIDLYFRSHKQALKWGKVKTNVSVWLTRPPAHAEAQPTDRR